MEVMKRDGVALAYTDTGSAGPSLVFVHGCGCTHTSLAPQIEFFAHTHRVIAVDLRGHGESDAPQQDYTVPAFADDIVWLIGQLDLHQLAIVGHSMGGNIALEIAARSPHAISSAVFLDSFFFIPQERLVTIVPLVDALHGPDYLAAYQQALTRLCLPTDKRAQQEIASLRVPQHVLASAFPNHITQYDPTPAASACTLPVALITADVQLGDPARLQSLIPQLVLAKTLGSGHFSPLEVPDQINSMVARFLEQNPPPSTGPAAGIS